MKRRQLDVTVRNTRPEDVEGIIALTRAVYPESPPWTEAQLRAHQDVFPRGQFVAVEGSGRILGMAASLIVRWDDYDEADSWRDFTAGGSFANHDPVLGKTLYGAEVMVAPGTQGRGVGSRLYAARSRLATSLGLWRIRAGARLRGYGKVAALLTPEAYVREVVAGRMADPTLTFQLRRGFKAVGVVGGYLKHDPESLGFAAIIEWMNPRFASSLSSPQTKLGDPSRVVF